MGNMLHGKHGIKDFGSSFIKLLFGLIGDITNLKYKLQLSMYGNVVERADVVIEAESQMEAEKKALGQAENGLIKFTEKGEAPDGFDYQVENCEESK